MSNEAEGRRGVTRSALHGNDGHMRRAARLHGRGSPVTSQWLLRTVLIPDNQWHVTSDRCHREKSSPRTRKDLHLVFIIMSC